MKLQVSILVIGIALSAGSVSAELHRSASVASATQTAGTTTVASQSSLKQSITTTSKVSLSGVRPSIKGGSGDD